MPHDLDAPGEAGITAAVEDAWDKCFGPPDSEVDRDLKTCAAFRKIRRDPDRWAAVQRRAAELMESVEKKEGPQDE